MWPDGSANTMPTLRASAPGKIILFGEHAVVHGQPAIAVPLDAVQVTVSVEPAAPGSGLMVHAPDMDQTLRIDLAVTESNEPLHDAVIYPVHVALQALGCALPDATLTIRSTIPVASGLGSGAALAAALIRALGLACDQPFADEKLNRLVFEVEKRHHGTPSGIDNTVIVFRQPVYFVRGAPPQSFRIPHPFTLLVAGSGHSTPTHLTVSAVRELYHANPDTIGP
ncbi:MAG: mevalonate kinase, partial [Chloroflexi bacterium]|nr:mevalonate kinase [Chloroflexota bacterium]